MKRYSIYMTARKPWAPTKNVVCPGIPAENAEDAVNEILRTHDMTSWKITRVEEEHGKAWEWLDVGKVDLKGI